MIYGEGSCADKFADFESAFYAFAIGLTTISYLNRPLNWSQATPERKMYVSLTELWTTKTTSPHEHPRDVPGEVIFQPAMFDSLISLLNARRKSRDCIVYQQKEDRWDPLSNSHESLFPSSVLVRQVNNRWECFGYFNQDRSLALTSDRPVASSIPFTEDRFKTWNSFFTSSGNDSSQVSKPTSSDGVSLNTFSPIVQVDIKPVATFDTPADARIPTPSLDKDSWENTSIETMTAFLRRKTSFHFVHGFEELCSGLEVLDMPRKEAIQPTVGLLCRQFVKAAVVAMTLTAILDDVLTSEEKQEILTKTNGLARKEERVNQKKDEAGEQKEEDVEQTKRKEAEEAAAAYAAQDRDDSCSDSD